MCLGFKCCIITRVFVLRLVGDVDFFTGSLFVAEVRRVLSLADTLY